MPAYRSHHRTIAVSAFLVLAAFADHLAAVPPSYHVTDLGTLGGAASNAWGINSSGHVVGWSNTTDFPFTRAFRWTPNTPNGITGTLTDLGFLFGDSYAWGINDAGNVSGFSGLKAFVYDGATHDIGTLGGTVSEAKGINARGQVVGSSSPAEGPPHHAFLWTPTMPNGSSGAMIDLGTLGGSGSNAWGINASGQVAGDSYTVGNTQTHASLWQPNTPNGTSGAMHDLGTLGGTFSSALSINDAGQVVGYSYTTGDAGSHAFLWTPTTLNATTGTMVDLGALGGTPGTSPYGSFAYGLNSNGQVVGYSYTDGDFDQHAFMYTSATGMIDLNALIDPLSGWELNVARAINDAGQIVGAGYFNGQVRAFLLTPVPDPTIASLLIVGLPLLILLILQRSPRCARN